ncbi:MAG: phosphoribosylformylglycinamidine synthase [Alphaproteobacteria bacterium]|nr:phosphoribosylformylglycinamidine synthase [Alphaproteobacteria bacterium]NCQ88102.1 phosphoribosylformylglycinamidine synthase [Alphaproteobacteria bacterium]NCT05391.1 phosphoribosylformylglycinamidine synthase [Alphaproteobacteria bacterium]
MVQRIEVFTLTEDGRAKTLEDQFKKSGQKVDSVRVVDVYTIEEGIKDAASLDDCLKSFTNPVTQKAFVLEAGQEPANDYMETAGDFDWALEIGYLPGVTDNIGHTASELTALTLGRNKTLYSSRVILLKGTLSEDDVKALAADLHNPLIQRASNKNKAQFTKEGGMDAFIPRVVLDNKGAAIDSVDLNVSDEELITIGKEGIKNEDGTRRGPLGMSLLYMQAVQQHFAKEGRNPTDVELETLAQTWSEHCKHTIFASPIDDIKDGLYKHYIKGATNEIRKARGDDDFCISVFSDNSGGIIFDDNWMITDKVETHNSPSALDPFGGAITGIVGVNRDCLGFGQGAKPVLNRYGFCLADPRKDLEYYRGKNKMNPTLSPDTIMKGVVAGVEAGGNQSGIPTPQGFMYFDDRYVGKPLVFAGTVGVIPREINGKPSHIKSAKNGDRIVMIGGKVGRDGIHGATFSSVALDEGSPATAVQIGDPITQKKFMDAIVKEIRGLGLYNAITDNGAGGLASSVGEMGESSGGFCLALDKVPLKYPGMQPWEIWISESQERMTLSVPAQNIDTLFKLLEKRGVEAWDIGEFNNSGRAVLTWHGDTAMDMSMEFLHDGIPETPLKTTFTRGGEPEPDIAEPSDYAKMLIDMMGRLNICSKEFVAAQYDHNVQGSAVLGPIQGRGRVFADATVSRPVLNSKRAAVLSQGLAPRYSDIDTHHMARAALDTAVRNAIAAGGDIDHLALLDNICWCSSDEPERLGQLKRAMAAIYHLAKTYRTPFISGKDSMFNDFRGYDADNNPVTISVPPTLLISAIGVIEDVAHAVSIDPKAAGDLVYILGETKDELGGSEYYDHLGHLGNNVPEMHDEPNYALYRALTIANKQQLCASAMAVGFGGLGVTLAKKAIASGLGMDISIDSDLRLDKLLFSESQGRIIVTVSPDDQSAFETTMSGLEHVALIGEVTNYNHLYINGIKNDIEALSQSYKSTLGGY